MPSPSDASSQPPGWNQLITPEGLRMLRTVAADLGAGNTLQAAGAKLRAAGVIPEQVAAVLTQTELRRKASSKFGDLAEHLLFTPAGLEQATRASVTALHAQRFVRAGCRHVADLGCGIGAESLALAAAGIAVTAVEIDSFTAMAARHNLDVVTAHHATPPHTESGQEAFAQVIETDAEQFVLADAGRTAGVPVDGVFLDPARRTAGRSNTRRLASPDDYSPSLTFAFGLADSLPTGIKLGPGFDRELITPHAEAQWVSVDGAVVETGVWFGAAARAGIHRAALVIRGGHVSELTAAEDALDVPVGPRREYLYEPDGAVIRARLIGKLARQVDAALLSAGIAYLTSEQPVQTPFATLFRIVEVLPAREKDLRVALAKRDIGVLEIKKRGADVDPAALRKRLKLRGKAHATLFLTREAGAHVAYLAERVPGSDPTPPALQ